MADNEITEQRPVYDADILRRAAAACRNYVRQAGMTTGEGEWFDWVPKYLDSLADQRENGQSITPGSSDQNGS